MLNLCPDTADIIWIMIFLLNELKHVRTFSPSLTANDGLTCSSLVLAERLLETFLIGNY